MCSVIALLDEGGVSVDAALELPGAGPAPGSLVFACRDRARAGDAADRGIALLVQRVDGNLIDDRVRVDALRAPVDERLDLPDAVPLGPLDLLGVGAGRALLAPDAGDPRVVLRERAL